MTRIEDVIAPNGKTWEEIRAKRMAAQEKRRKKSQKGQKKARTKKKPEVRVGKTGRIRLTGEALAELRRACFDRDLWKCVECGKAVSWAGMTSFMNDYILPRGEMAHIQSRGAGGSDILENVRTLCPKCHRDEHNAGGKPCPKKERACGVQG